MGVITLNNGRFFPLIFYSIFFSLILILPRRTKLIIALSPLNLEYSKVTRENIEQLTSEAEYESFQEYFFRFVDQTSPTIPLPDTPAQQEIKQKNQELGELGVNTYGSHSLQDLRLHLAMPNSLTPSMYPYRHKASLDPYNHPMAFALIKKDQPLPPLIKPQALREHQMVGLAEIITRAFFKEAQATGAGLLLADDVGVGKTAQIIAFICWLADQIDLLKANLPMAPIISMSPLSLSF